MPRLRASSLFSSSAAVRGRAAWAGALLLAGLLSSPALAGHHESGGDQGRKAAAADPERTQGVPRSARPEAARLYVIAPADGATVESPVVVRFGLANMGVAPAGVNKPATGHHHLLVDAELPPPNLPIPKDENHLHFGGGQTEVTLELAPGTHTLQLLLGDHLHIPHDPPVVSERVTITVKASD